MLRQATREEDVDARLRRTGRPGLPAGGRSTQGLDMIATQSQQADRSGLDCHAAGKLWMVELAHETLRLTLVHNLSEYTTKIVSSHTNLDITT